MNAGQFALQAWSKAEAHLAEAATLSPELTPGATVHLAYYAMFHAVRAIFLQTTGSSPKKHASVVSQFSLLSRDRRVEFRRAAENLRDIQDRRIRADYNDTARISPEAAEDALRKSTEFLDLVAREFGFTRAEPPRHG